MKKNEKIASEKMAILNKVLLFGGLFILFLSVNVMAASCTGGTITTDGAYNIHTFTSSDTFECSGNINAEVLVVAGGGAGSTYDGGGGGAGGLLYDANHAVILNTPYTITVGAGGAGGYSYGPYPTNGENSVFDDMIAIGGGVGAIGGGAVGYLAGNGGSGGGGSGTPGQVFGGNGYLGIPKTVTMTSNTDPSGYIASASNELFGQYLAYNAFKNQDPTDATGWATYWIGQGGSGTEWLQWQSPSSFIAKKYAITTRGVGDFARAPSDWTFEGSNDGSSWTTLDTQTGITDWTNINNIKKQFILTNTNSYSYYRIYITGSTDNDYMGVGNLQVYDGTGAQGYPGGNCGYEDYYTPAGGGGGAGEKGGDSTALGGDGHGGVGLYFSQFAGVAGSPAGWFAGGGGGGSYGGGYGTGGLGGGGSGTDYDGAGAGIPNTGGGAGGAGQIESITNGGSGIVIIRYLNTPTLTVVSPINATYYNNSNITINFTADSFDSLWYNNGTSDVNISFTNGIAQYFNTSNGRYVFTFYANSSGGSISSDTRTFWIDTLKPQINYSSIGTENNSTSFSRNWIYVNVSTIELNPKNITYYLYYQNGSLKNSTTYLMTTQTSNNTINFTNLVSGIYYYNTTAYDLAGNFNSTETRKITLDQIAPNINSVIYSPNSSGEIDPLKNITFTTNISDNLVGIGSVILRVFNGTWSNYSMVNISGNASNSIYSYNLTLDSTEKNYTFSVWTNDTAGNINYSANSTFESFYDCTWNLVNLTPTSAAGFDVNKFIGSFIINNTGDSNYNNNNCTLIFAVSHNGVGGEIYFDNDENMLINIRKLYSIGVGNYSNISVNYSFGKGVSQKTYTINVSDYYARSATKSLSTDGIAVTNKDKPYLIQYADVQPSNSYYLTPQNISLGGYIKNIMGSSNYDENLTAFNVTLNWTFVSSFTNISGNISNMFGNVSDNNQNRNDVNISFTNLASMVPGTYNFTLSSSGVDYLGNPINDSSNNSILNETFSIIFSCYTFPDNVTIGACGSLDGDYITPTIGGPGGSSSGGGGGGGGASSGSFAKSEANFELVRGDNQYFELVLENKVANPKKDISIKITGNNSQYVSAEPSTISYLGANSKENVKFRINAPSYFSAGKYLLQVEFSGLIEGNTTTRFAEVKYVTLTILELPRKEADGYLNTSLDILSKMNASGLYLDEVRTILDLMNSNYEALNFINLKDEAKQISDIYIAATEYSKLKDELNSSMIEAENNGITVSETKKLFLLSEILFNRGDYVAAYAKMKEAKTSFLLETKGEFKILYYVKNNPAQSFGVLISLSLVGVGSSLLVRIRLLKRKMRMLAEEEELLLQLMRVVQRDCFENNKMSMEEYSEAMYQYENRLGNVIQEKVTTETTISNLMKIGGRKKALGQEKDRLTILVRQTQDDYLNRGKLDTRIYENMLRTYATRLSKIEEELVFMEAQEQIREVSGWFGNFFKKRK